MNINREIQKERKILNKPLKKELTEALRSMRRDIASFKLGSRLSKREKAFLRKVEIRLAALIKMRGEL